MDTSLDLTAAPREVLLAAIAQQQAAVLELQATVTTQQAVIVQLQRRIETLEGKAKPGGPRGMPGVKPQSGQRPPREKQNRNPRPHGFARQRMTPTQRVEHVLEECPGCGTGLSGGWTQRTREVIDLPLVPVQVTEHVYVARTCPLCQRRCVPSAQLQGVVLGKQRLGVNLVSLIAALREEARLPWRTIQWYLGTVHGLHLSLGALVDAAGKVAGRAQSELAGIVERIRGSPVVHADETGWREDGHNGYVWTLRPSDTSCGGDATVVDEVLGEEFAGVLVSDFYAAYHHDGPKQRCWAHLLRDVHDLRVLYPKDDRLSRWAGAVHQLYRRPWLLPIRRRNNQTNNQTNNAAPPNWPWKDACWRSAVPSWMTHWRSRPGYAGAWRGTSRNSSSSWPNPRRRRITTPPSACARW